MEDFELEPGEKILRLVRKHWFVFVLQFIPFLILAALPFLLVPLAKFLMANTPAGAPLYAPLVDFARAGLFGSPLMRLMVGTWWLFVWLAAFNLFTNYFLKAWLITNERIVDIDQHGFFRREVSSLLLDRVQDVTTDVNGVLATLIDFGNIHVQTAGTIERFHMRGVPNPKALRDVILQEVARVQKLNPNATGGV
ncbi:MAG: PH domain-containing protein [Patescibacteria group bacterium]|nr:PH domain-containing protein [Patescibacteria group bacterium]MDE1966359.1 PH domain-containing protein [Patescibacteria group bacterium]